MASETDVEDDDESYEKNDISANPIQREFNEANSLVFENNLRKFLKNNPAPKTKTKTKTRK